MAANQALTIVQPTHVAQRWRPELSTEEIEILRKRYFANASDAELRVAVMTCNRLQLDPFSKQIEFIPIRGSLVPVVAIAGQRVIAERTGKYAGQKDQEWCGEDGKWVKIWLSDKPPAGARCGVKRHGWDEPLYAVARFASYARLDGRGQPTGNWKTMPDVMVHKCAEAAALRKAFPQELCGVYAPEELDHVADGQQLPAPQPTDYDESRVPGLLETVEHCADINQLRAMYAHEKRAGCPHTLLDAIKARAEGLGGKVNGDSKPEEKTIKFGFRNGPPEPHAPAEPEPQAPDPIDADDVPY